MHETDGSDGWVAVVGTDATGRTIAAAADAAGYDVRLATAPGDDPASDAPADFDDREALPLETALDGAGLVFEATAESTALERVAALTPADAILATTNTSPLAELAAVTGRPERVVGVYPAGPSLSAVELGHGERTDGDVVSRVRELFEASETPAYEVDGEVPGSISERLTLRFRLEAIRRLEGGTDPAAIDAAVKRLGFPRGPLEAADRDGLDDLERSAKTLVEYGVAVHVPDRLSALVEDGALGTEAGAGVYGSDEPQAPRERRYEVDPWPLFAPVVNEAARLLEVDATTRAAIDALLEQGANWPRGPLRLADEYGIDRVVERLQAAHEATGRATYDPRPTLRELVASGTVGLASGEGFYGYEYESRTFETVRYERRDCLAVITLDRPHVLNALDEASWLGLRRALEHADADDGVRATILRGAGRAFSAGDDIAEMYGWEADEEATTFFQEVLGPTVETLRQHSKPTIAVIDGIATGGGCELVLVCDLAVASHKSELGLPEALIGAIPPIAPAYGLTSLRKKDFFELAYTGDRLSGLEATERGLVNYAVDADQVEDVARELARATTAASPASTAAIKRGWNRMETEFHEPFFEAYLESVAERVQSADGQEGMGAFLEKRAPEWVR
ncbi:enoyl-CoA hydratase-related protein [Natronobeatus ordinarius]|uniref:enoyl-CoA hydratase-related protein n=1 Tax=Natronobeatus ordinarius TaxID=2963433 RepID=UPI0020CD662E|nr:enoyl-CoA hydratase-related protein [Natronobeatus ordinarius]